MVELSGIEPLTSSQCTAILLGRINPSEAGKDNENRRSKPDGAILIRTGL
jgi:hypothetical protein